MKSLALIPVEYVLVMLFIVGICSIAFITGADVELETIDYQTRLKVYCNSEHPIESLCEGVRK